jgi:hypothetical protein
MAGLPRKPAPDERKRRGGKGRRRWLRYLLAAFALLLLITGGVAYYSYVSFAALIDARLHGERERTLPRVYARPIELRRGQALSEADLIVRLNDLGYAHRAQVQRPGEFAVLRDTVAIRPSVARNRMAYCSPMMLVSVDNTVRLPAPLRSMTTSCAWCYFACAGLLKANRCACRRSDMPGSGVVGTCSLEQ